MFAWLERWWPRAQSSFGAQGESAAAKYLRSLGYRILAHGLRTRLGELDLIALDGQTTVFVEVKTRSSREHGLPTDAITPDKQRRMTLAALGYLKQHRLLDRPARFDVVAITWPDDGPAQIEHFKNAFESSGIGGMFS
jgi:putative endonuclease